MLLSLSQSNGTQTQLTFEDLIKRTPLTVLYFYPKDDTPGCTKEAHDFTEMVPLFTHAGAQVIWVSKDTHKSHCSFISKHWLSFDLVSDPTWELHKQFDAVWEKSMYGKKYQWTIRSTFIIDHHGTILHERRNVSVTNHVATVLSSL